jgi:hypothetical protein
VVLVGFGLALLPVQQARGCRALVRPAAQNSAPLPYAVLPDGPAHDGQSGGKCVAPVRRAADLYRGGTDGLGTPAGMVNGGRMRVSHRLFTNVAAVRGQVYP